MREIRIIDAAFRLPELLRDLKAGDEIVLVDGGRSVATIKPIPDRKRIRLGIAEGLFSIPDDFDAPLPDDILDLFEGR